MNPMPRRIGFVSTRFAGTDGVSLETEKWADILTSLRNECFYFAGECDRPANRTYLVPEAHFKHPAMLELHAELFDRETRSPDTSRLIQGFKEHLKTHLHEFVRKFNLHLLIVENALSLPINIPLGLALTEFIAETSFPTIAHHHDFYWERKRFAITAAADYLRMAFPPTLPSIRHVVINSFARRQLALRTGVSSVLIPNVMDFDTPPPPPDDYSAQLRRDLGLEPHEHLLLQPTRVVPRKRIELAIELTRRLGKDCVLVISHASGDEGTEYVRYLQEYAKLLGVRVIYASDIINHVRGQTPDGRRVYALADVYQQASLVTYPSLIEGFGNAFLETIYYKRPIVISTYEIFKADIQPKGFQVIGFEDFIQDETVAQARHILEDPEEAQVMVEHNYEIGRRYYSFRTLESNLIALLYEFFGI